MGKINYILFDAANTLIHKPDLWIRMEEVLLKYNYKIEMQQLKRIHKIVSEVVVFPDRTSEDFYREFNSKFLFALGIIPVESILQDLFRSCTYLNWEAFEDSALLSQVDRKMGVISNFNTTLDGILKKLVPVSFSDIIISETQKVRKPSLDFYKIGLDAIQVAPAEILYIGDSLELDIFPAMQLGINTCLIDRDSNYPYYKHRISSFSEINGYIKIVENAGK